ncbi:D-beta-hydroxybutyrate permease [gamma proteobacterium IMCC2047]|nr:D-beta-hydroxybutyrate permease [gamma proteobacterium IMCC2047]
MKKISRLFLQGLLAILPIAITIAVLFWLASFAEQTLGSVIRWLLPEDWYWPGLGVIAGLIFIFLIGVLMNAYLFRKMGSWAERLLGKIPLVKTIYNSVRDIARFASPERSKDELQKAVLVRLDNDLRVIGFVTNTSPPVTGDLVAVYLPMSYQIGGYTLFVPESRLQELDMSVPDAMRLALTAAITSPGSRK